MFHLWQSTHDFYRADLACSVKFKPMPKAFVKFVRSTHWRAEEHDFTQVIDAQVWYTSALRF